MISYTRDHPDFCYFQQYDYANSSEHIVVRGEFIGILEDDECLLFRVNSSTEQKFEFDFFMLGFSSFFELAKASDVQAVIFC